MAYIYPHARIDNGTVVDPRPFNRTLGRYGAEMSGMLDRDNFEQAVFNAAKIANPTGSNNSTETEVTGTFTHAKSWRSVATQTLSAASAIRMQRLTNVGGSFVSDDSGLSIDFSASHTWLSTGYPNRLYNYIEYVILVDGVEVDRSGPIGTTWEQGYVYLCPYVAVGAGTHNIEVLARIYYINDSTPVISPSLYDCEIHSRELIVLEGVR